MKNEPEFFEHHCKKAIRSSVHVIARNDLIPGLQKFDYRVSRCNSTAKCQSIFPVLNDGQCLFQGFSGRVLRACILKSFMHARSRLDVCRGLKYGCHDRASRGIWFSPSMNKFGCKLHMRKLWLQRCEISVNRFVKAQNYKNCADTRYLQSKLFFS